MRLLLVSAPAGFGKTTFVSDWLETTKRPFAWLTLDRDDNDMRPNAVMSFSKTARLARPRRPYGRIRSG